MNSCCRQIPISVLTKVDQASKFGCLKLTYKDILYGRTFSSYRLTMVTLGRFFQVMNEAFCVVYIMLQIFVLRALVLCPKLVIYRFQISKIVLKCVLIFRFCYLLVWVIFIYFWAKFWPQYIYCSAANFMIKSYWRSIQIWNIIILVFKRFCLLREMIIVI
jgi:hypothetical protein